MNHTRNENQEDVVIDDEADALDDIEIEEAEELSGDKLKSLRAKLKACEEAKRHALEDAQRAKADFLNSKRRLTDQLVRDTARISESYIRDLLPLADSFAMARQDPNWETCDEKWRKGVEAIHAQLMNVLQKHDVTPIDETGVPFDPNVHEAVSQAPVSDPKEIDTVTQILQTGYRTSDTVIRHAKVVVGGN